MSRSTFLNKLRLKACNNESAGSKLLPTLCKVLNQILINLSSNQHSKQQSKLYQQHQAVQTVFCCFHLFFPRIAQLRAEIASATLTLSRATAALRALEDRSEGREASQSGLLRARSEGPQQRLARSLLVDGKITASTVENMWKLVIYCWCYWTGMTLCWMMEIGGRNWELIMGNIIDMDLLVLNALTLSFSH